MCYHNKKVTKKRLALGDLVMHNTQVTRINQSKGKLAPKWEPPYFISEEVHPGMFHLVYKDGQKIERTCHVGYLSKYHQ